MGYNQGLGLPSDYDIADGKSGIIPVFKFGRNSAVGTSFVPVSSGGVYQTPQAASATTVRVKAGGNAADTAAGAGAREVTVQGLDATGALVSEAIATAGASASAVTTTTFMRIFRAYVSASGTYATASAGSHTAAITIENGAGGTDWLTIDATDFTKGQIQIGSYTVPLGYKAYLHEIQIQIASTKVVDVILFKRGNILEAAAPYSAMRADQVYNGLTEAGLHLHFKYPKVFQPLTDIGFMAKVASSTAGVSVEFNLQLVPQA